MMFKKIISVCMVAGLVGCAKSPHKYEANESRALNVARAGGIYDSDLRDSADGMNSYSTSFLMSALNVANLATSFQGSAIGLGGQANFLVKSVDIAATPDNPSARPSFVAWVPKSLAGSEEKAKAKLLDEIHLALERTAENLDFQVTRLNVSQDVPKMLRVPMFFWSIYAPNYGCTGGNCLIAAYVDKPYIFPTPEFLQNDMEADSYAFSAEHQRRYPRLLLSKKNGRNFPEKDLYTTLSKHLPAWIALYFPPGSIYQDGKPLVYPVVFEKGEMLLFKSPS